MTTQGRFVRVERADNKSEYINLKAIQAFGPNNATTPYVPTDGICSPPFDQAPSILFVFGSCFCVQSLN